MFTGIIAEIGHIKKIESKKSGKELTIEAPKIGPDLQLGDSVAINGVCQTVTHIYSDNKSLFAVFVAPVTVQKTNFSELRPQTAVNLELALTLKDRLGGHLVSGHVNGVATITQIINNGQATLFSLKIPSHLCRYTVLEGSLTVDGISLTIADLQNDIVTLSVIPHTLEQTTLQFKKVGHLLNVEVDIIAKYVESLLLKKSDQQVDRDVDRDKRLWSLLQQG